MSSNEILDVRARLPAHLVDYLRPHARRRGFGNSSAAAIRFAVTELASVMRGRSAEETATRNENKPT